MRSPFRSEPEAFQFVLLLILALIPIVLAAALGPTWLVLVLLVVVIALLVARASQLHLRKLRGLEMPVKMAPPHVGPASERRVLVVANDTLGEDALLGEVERLAGAPGTRIFLLVPALITGGARLTGAVDGLLARARAGLATALDRVGHPAVVAGDVSSADPLQAVEDAFTTFAPDEVIVATHWEQPASGLEPQLAGLVRERFAVPVRHLVFDPGSDAREPDQSTEARYRRESGQTASRMFGLKALAGAGILAALAISLVAFVQSSERDEANAASKAAAEQAAAMPKVATTVTLSVIPEYKPGPEGEKHDAFTTTNFIVHAGQSQTLTIDNTDDVPHSITAPAQASTS